VAYPHTIKECGFATINIINKKIELNRELAERQYSASALSFAKFKNREILELEPII